MKYDFTGKERDNETNYDYFGARYYDSRIANWTSIDPLFEKHFDYSPYNYVLRNPIRLIDPDGRQVEVIAGTAATAIAIGATIVAGYAAYQIASKMIKTGPSTYTLVTPIQVLEVYGESYNFIEWMITQVLMTEGSKITGIESQIKQIEEHLGSDKIGGMSPNDPDPHNTKGKWKKDIIRAIKEAYKDFNQAFRKQKSKRNNPDAFKEYLDKTFGKDRMKDMYDKLKEQDIQIDKIIN